MQILAVCRSQPAGLIEATRLGSVLLDATLQRRFQGILGLDRVSDLCKIEAELAGEKLPRKPFEVDVVDITYTAS